MDNDELEGKGAVQPSDESNKHDSELKPIIPSSNTVRLWLYGTVSGLCFAFGGAFLGNHLKVGWLIFFIAAFFVALSVRQFLLNNRTKHPIRKGWPTAWGVIVFVIGGAACLLGYLSEDNSPRRKYFISAEPAPHGASLSPFDTFVTVKNTSQQPIYNVRFRVWWHEPTGVTRFHVFDYTSPTIIPKMEPTVPQDWIFGWTPDAAPSVEQNTKIFVEIVFSTQPKASTPQTNIFRFQIKNMYGQAVWAHDGEGEAYRDVLNEAMPPTNFNERQEWQLFMPVLVIKDVTFSKTNPAPSFPLRIDYVITNTGGEMATNVEVVWSFVNLTKNKEYSGLHDTNYVPFQVLPKWAVPSFDSFADHPEGQTNSLYDLVLNRDLSLIGTVTYNDPLGHYYKLKAQAIPTNGIFSIQILQFAAPLDLLKTGDGDGIHDTNMDFNHVKIGNFSLERLDSTVGNLLGLYANPRSNPDGQGMIDFIAYTNNAFLAVQTYFLRNWVSASSYDSAFFYASSAINLFERNKEKGVLWAVQLTTKETSGLYAIAAESLDETEKEPLLAQQLARKAYELNPKDPFAGPVLANTCGNLAFTLARGKKFDISLSNVLEAIHLYETHSNEVENFLAPRVIAKWYILASYCNQKLGRNEEAGKWAQTAVMKFPSEQTVQREAQLLHDLQFTNAYDAFMETWYALTVSNGHVLSLNFRTNHAAAVKSNIQALSFAVCDTNGNWVDLTNDFILLTKEGPGHTLPTSGCLVVPIETNAKSCELIIAIGVIGPPPTNLQVYAAFPSKFRMTPTGESENRAFDWKKVDTTLKSPEGDASAWGSRVPPIKSGDFWFFSPLKMALTNQTAPAIFPMVLQAFAHNYSDLNVSLDVAVAKVPPGATPKAPFIELMTDGKIPLNPSDCYYFPETNRVLTNDLH